MIMLTDTGGCLTMPSMKIVLPYCTDISINRKYKDRAFHKATGYKDYQEMVYWECIKTGKFRDFKKQTKTYFDTIVYRPDMRTDVTDNFMKGIFDAVQKAIGVRDSWYAIKSWDWVNLACKKGDKECLRSARLEITITQ